jgi:ABC-2 type transport system permease protein
MVILGIVAFNDGDEDPIDIGIVDKSNTILSQQFISRLSENNLFNIIIKNDNSLKDDLISGKLKAGLVIPNGLTAQPRAADIKLLVDRSDIQFIQTIQPILNNSLLEIERELTKVEPLFILTLEDIKSRSLSYINFLLPGIMAFMLMNLSIAGSGFNVVEFRRRGILKRLFVTPIKPIDFVTAIVLARMIIVIAQLTIVFSFALFALDVEIVGSLLTFYFMIMLGILMFLTLGFSIGSLAKSQESVGVLASIFIYPQLALSGVFFPIESLPEFIHPFAALLPLSILVESLRLIANDGLMVLDLLGNFIGMVVWIIFGTFLSTKLFIWKEVAG